MLGMPVWVTSEDGEITYLNQRAEALFGKTAEECIGENCHAVVGGRRPSGSSFCQPNCTVRRMAALGQEIEPFALIIPGHGRPNDHVRVVVIAARTPLIGDNQRTVYVHCVVDDARHERFKKYLDKVVSRSPHAGSDELSLEEFQLTPREQEILRLLAEDETLHGIAHRLDLSYATIRNHVQHILGKLGVHSILEAVAFYLLVEE
jgi:DNA-binding CsgD family transcriptional regulator